MKECKSDLLAEIPILALFKVHENLPGYKVFGHFFAQALDFLEKFFPALVLYLPHIRTYLY